MKLIPEKIFFLIVVIGQHYLLVFGRILQVPLSIFFLYDFDQKNENGFHQQKEMVEVSMESS